MNTAINTKQVKPLHQQNQQLAWSMACRLPRAGSSSAERQFSFSQQKQIERQARNQSGCL